MLWSPVYYVSLSLYNAMHVLLIKLHVWSFWLLSIQRWLECFYGIYRDRHFIWSGDMCSLPSHPGHSSRISSCCDVLLQRLMFCLFCEVYGFFVQARGLVPTKGCWKVFLYGTIKTGMLYIFRIYVKLAVRPCLSQGCCSWSCMDLLQSFRRSKFNN